MLRAIIIDDEQNGIDSLKLIISNYIPDIRVVASTTDSTAAKSLIEDFKPEVVFMDISMPILNGFEVLQSLTFKTFGLIFTTAHRQYALKAIKYDALDYLLKPIDSNELSKAIDKIKSKSLENNTIDFANLYNDLLGENRKRINIHSKNEVRYLNLKEIIRVEADSNSSVFHMIDGQSHLSTRTLKEFESALCEENNFMRIHQSHIVNLIYIVRFYKKMNGFAVMINDDEVPVSRKQKRGVFKVVEHKIKLKE